MNILSWPHFVQLQHIRNLSIDEQVKRYNYYLMEQNLAQIQMMEQQSVGSGKRTIEPVYTWNFEVGSDSEGTVYSFDVITKSDKSLTLTISWDSTDLVTAGSSVVNIPPATTQVVSVDLGAADSNVPMQIAFSDPTAVNTLTFGGGYIMQKAPTNISGLTGTQLVNFQFQALSNPTSLDITGFTGTSFHWEDDTSVQSINLTNVNVTNTLQMYGNASLTSLTLTGFVFNENMTITFEDCALNESTINQLLILADASGVETATLNISNEGGFGNATPTGDGETARDNLVNKGWTITYNT